MSIAAFRQRDHRQMILDLFSTSGDSGAQAAAWNGTFPTFSSAKAPLEEVLVEI